MANGGEPTVRVAGYEDLVEIGQGGFAVVYRAHQPAFGRDVAVKVLTSPPKSDEDRQRFERECLAMGKVSWHPNIVVVHDAGETDGGLPYLAMEFLEGGSLGDRLERGGALPWQEAVDHTIRLAGALHTAHATGLLHRDIKPDNALVDAFGRIKLADFGIAALAGTSVTASGVVTATVAHAAPEILGGQRATPLSDVYSLGSTLFELLAGEAAFVRPDDESLVPVMMRTASDPVPDLRPRGVPEALASAVESAMAKDGADRPDALSLGRALQDAQRDLGVPVTELPVKGAAGRAVAAPATPAAALEAPPAQPSRPAGSPQTAPRPAPPVFISYSSDDQAVARDVCATLEPEGMPCWMAPRDVTAGSDWVGAITGALGTCRLVIVVVSDSTNRSAHVLREVERATHRNVPILPLRIRDAEPSENLAYFIGGSQWLDLPDGSLDGRRGHLVGAASALLEKPSARFTRSSPPPRRRAGRRWVPAAVAALLLAVGAAAAYLAFGPGTEDGGEGAALTIGDEAWTAATDGPILSSPLLSDDRVLVGSDDQSVYAYDAASGEEQWRAATGGPVRAAPTSASGVVYVGSFDGSVYALSAADGSERWATPIGFEIFSSPTVDGSTVYVGGDGLHALDVATGEERWEYATGSPVNSSPAVVDGTVYVGSDSGIVHAVDAATGGERWQFETGDPVNSSPAVADGVVYVGSIDGFLYAIDAETGEEQWRFETDEGINSSPAVREELVYVGSRDGALYAVETESGNERWRFDTRDRVESSPAVLSRTVYVGSNDRFLYAIDALSGEERWRFETGGPIVAAPAAASGRVIVASGDGSVYAVEPPSD